MSRLLVGAGVFVAGAAIGCGDAVTRPPDVRFSPVDLAAPWEIASPAAVGVDRDLVEAALGEAAAIPRLRSLVAVKDGRIFLESYYGGRTSPDLHDVRSVTKSVVGTLVGLAIERGHIEGLGQPIGELLPEEVAALTPEQAEITIRHLLTMSSGFQWDENGGDDYNTWISSEDHISALLERPLVDEPGTAFTYNSAAVHLLGVVVEAAVGEPLPEFAHRELFAPIGIDVAEWEELPGPYVNGGSGIDLRARDLARFGQLYLQDGLSGDRRVLPAGWVDAATAPAYAWRADYGSLRQYTYGFLWWVVEGEPQPAYTAWGYGGQFVYVVPELRLVVVATTDWRGVSGEGGVGPLTRQVLAIAVDRLHRAARGR